MSGYEPFFGHHPQQPAAEADEDAKQQRASHKGGCRPFAGGRVGMAALASLALLVTMAASVSFGLSPQQYHGVAAADPRRLLLQRQHPDEGADYADGPASGRGAGDNVMDGDADVGSRPMLPVQGGARVGVRRAAQMAGALSRCREDAYLELRSSCERNLDDIMRLYTKGEHGQSCQRLRQYTACVGRALNRTRCQRVPELSLRERQRLRANVNDYNWSCSMSKQEYAAGGSAGAGLGASANCDGKELINHHMKCGSTFQNFVGSINVYRDKAKACRAVRDYKDCVKPIFQNEECQSNQELMDRLLRFSHTVLKEYSSACKERRGDGDYQDSPGGDRDDAGDEDGVGAGFCRFEQLRQKTLQCQREGYSVIRTRDAHAKTDICEELKVFKDCAVAALRATHCSQEKNARQYVINTVKESFQRFGIECTGLWNTASVTQSSGTTVRVVQLALALSVALLGIGPP